MYLLTLYNKSDRTIDSYRVSGTATLDTILQTAALRYPNIEYATLTSVLPHPVSTKVGSIDVYDHPHLYEK